VCAEAQSSGRDVRIGAHRHLPYRRALAAA
jgi:hypothetical protein